MSTHPAAQEASAAESSPHASPAIGAKTGGEALERPLPGLPKLPPLPETDEELFRMYALTDSDRALREIVNRYQPKIMRYFERHSATRSRAEDLTQEVFVRLIRNRASFDPNQKFSTWSKTIAERIAINATRTEQRCRVSSYSDLAMDRHSDVAEMLEPVDADPLPDEIAGRSETRSLIEAALQRVEERYRAPAILHFLHGLTHTEAARRLGIPVGTAKSRTHHALADLRTILESAGLSAA